jgi:hypothetical protein
MLTPELSSSLAKIEQRVGQLEAKSLQDNLMMAAIKEDQDTEANKAMMDRLTIMGIRIPNVRRLKEDDKVKAMRTRVEKLLDYIKEEGQSVEVLFVRHLNGQARNPDSTVLEVKFASSKQASMIRTNFIKKRDSSELENINITPSVRLSTRVRIEVMKAIAGSLKAHDKSVTGALCVQFVNKPVIKVFRKDGGGQEYSKVMTYIDSVVWVMENGLEKKIDFRKAYDRAGSVFRGNIAQHFVILNN